MPRHYSNFDTEKSGNALDESSVERPRNVEGIPLPNEIEEASIPKNSRKGYNTPFNLDFIKDITPFNLDFIKNKIHIEELVLLGVIFLLLYEGIKDDFLIVLLIYVLLF